jgi:hypothetical protein
MGTVFNSPSRQTIDLRDLLICKVGDLHICQGHQAVELIYQQQVLQGPGLEEHRGIAVLRLYQGSTAALHILSILTSALQVTRRSRGWEPG